MSSRPKQPTKPSEVGALFRGDMVRAIIAAAEGDPNGKTETRRAIKPPPGEGWAPSHQHVATRADLARPSFEWVRRETACGEQEYRRVVSRWRPGDILWARETWRSVGWRPENGHLIEYQADERRVWREAPLDTSSTEVVDHQHPDRWRPSIFLFRWAVRLTMPVLAVRAERLTEITEAGVRAEGFAHAKLGTTPADYCRVYRQMHSLDTDADPWVWVVSWDPRSIEVAR